MKILGIDPGTATTGFGVIEVEGSKLKLIDFGCICTPAKLAIEKRLDQIFEELTILIKKHQPDEASVEELFFASNTKTAITVGHARGVILLALEKAGVKVSEYTPLQVKQALVGYGRAEKRQVQVMVKNILNLKEIPKQDDAADALAIAITHANSRKIAKLK